MPSFIGTGADQVPVNSMLGSLAYQNADDVKLGKITYSGTLVGTGNVGVGGTPVDNGACITICNPGTGSANLYLQNSTSGSSVTDGVVLNYDGSNVYLWAYENIPFVVATNNTQRFRVDQSGWAAFYSGGSTVVIGSGLIADGTTNDSILRWDSSGALKICKVTSTIAQFTNAGDFELKTTGYLKLPEGTTAQRPASPQEGMIRKNSSTGRNETFLRSTWRNMPEDEQGINLIDNSIFSVTNRPFTVARTSVSSFVMDRWYWRATNASASTSLSNTVFNDTSVYGYGLTFTNNAVVSSIPADSICCLRQTVFSHVSGVSKLKTGYMTLSFLVRGSTPGTYSLCIQSGLNEVYTTTYSVASSSSFNRVSITFPTPTLLTNVLIINFNIGTGADNQTAALNSWIASSTPKFATTGINLISQATNSTLTFAEVKLEFGDVATSFVMKDYVTDLHNCMRHYQNSYNSGISPGSTASYGGAIMASPSATTNYASFGSVRFNPPLEEGFLNSFVTYNPETGATGSARNTTTNTNVSVSTHFAGDKGASIRVNNVSVTGGNLLAIHWEADTGY